MYLSQFVIVELLLTNTGFFLNLRKAERLHVLVHQDYWNDATCRVPVILMHYKIRNYNEITVTYRTQSDTNFTNETTTQYTPTHNSLIHTTFTLIKSQ